MSDDEEVHFDHVSRFRDVVAHDIPGVPAGRLPVHLPVHELVLRRLWQEEVWAQTAWPDGERSLAELLRDSSSTDGSLGPAAALRR